MLPPSEQPCSSSTTTAAAPPTTTPLEPEPVLQLQQERHPDDTDTSDKTATVEQGGDSDNVTQKSVEVAEGDGIAEAVVKNGEGDNGAEAEICTVAEENVAKSCEGEEEKAGVEEKEGGDVEPTATCVKNDKEPENTSTVQSEEEKVVSENEVATEENVKLVAQAEAEGGVQEEEKGSDGESGNNVEEPERVEVMEEDSLLKFDSKEPQAPEVAAAPPADDGIVRASFVDFVDDRDPVDINYPTSDGKDDDGEDNGIMMMGNPELQKIREEQVRKWLIFEQENPLGSVGGVEGSLTASMDADSLATGSAAAGARGVGELMLMNGATEGDNVEGREGGDAEGMPRRVRFLTDQEGNLLISVFMTNTATTPLSEEQSILSNGQGGEGATEGDEVDAEQQNPSLVVSPPSLEPERDEGKEDAGEELVDSIEPSAPPAEDSASEDEEEPPSIVLIAPTHPLKEPPREKPPAPPTGDQDSANESSDETLSVSSCNSMIEILPSNESSSRVTITLEEVDNPETVEQQNGKCGDESEQRQSNGDADGDGGTITPCFQLGVMETLAPPPATVAPVGESEEETSGSPQPASLIIHELEEPNPTTEADNKEEPSSNEPPVVKMPNIDENNNIVEDSVLEEEEDDEEEEMITAVEKPYGTAAVLPQFNPEIGEQVMPELRRSNSSSSGEAEEDLERGNVPAPPPQVKHEEEQQRQVQQQQQQHHLMPPTCPDDDQEAQMVSLCIQEEHISAVAVTIAKWESMSKAQSTENLSNTGTASPPALNPASHAPVTKSASSPCPKTSYGGLMTSTPPQPPAKPTMKPVQPVAPVQTRESQQQQQVNRILVIHGSNSPVSNEPLVVSKAAGWSCWGNKVINNKEACPNAPPTATQGGVQHQENGGSNDEAIYAQPNPQAGSTMTSITNPSAILKSYPKPLSKGEIVNWLREGEIHRAGLLLNYAQSHHHAPVPGHPSNHLLSPVLVSWFFGLISRQQAERYLHGQPSGTFLVRISTRIWGYTLSYQASNGRTKHFLISAINPAVPSTLQIGPPDAALPPQSSKQQRMSPFLPQGRYAFIGTNMTPYGTLVSLIRHHSHAPITKLGGEKLLNPCPGGPQVAGLEHLFQRSAAAMPVAPSTPSTNLMMTSA